MYNKELIEKIIRSKSDDYTFSESFIVTLSTQIVEELNKLESIKRQANKYSVQLAELRASCPHLVILTYDGVNKPIRYCDTCGLEDL